MVYGQGEMDAGLYRSEGEWNVVPAPEVLSVQL